MLELLSPLISRPGAERGEGGLQTSGTVGVKRQAETLCSLDKSFNLAMGVVENKSFSGGDYRVGSANTSNSSFLSDGSLSEMAKIRVLKLNSFRV